MSNLLPVKTNPAIPPRMLQGPDDIGKSHLSVRVPEMVTTGTKRGIEEEGWLDFY